MARFARTTTYATGKEIWTHAQLTIRLWPVAGGYKAQDGLLHTWTLSQQEHENALRNGLERATMQEVTMSPLSR